VRLITIGLTAALLLIPVAPASAAPSSVYKSQASDFSAAKKKKAKKKSSKVEYMRAVPSK
jgi:hypothetical protein